MCIRTMRAYQEEDRAAIEDCKEMRNDEQNAEPQRVSKTGITPPEAVLR